MTSTAWMTSSAVSSSDPSGSVSGLGWPSSRSCAVVTRSFFFLMVVAMVALAPVAPCANATSRVTISSTHCYAAQGEKGLLIFPLDRYSAYVAIPPPQGLSKISDMFLEPGGRFLFVLSLGGSGGGSSFAVLSLANATAPTLVGGPVAVSAGPYGAVCGKAGTIVIAGGESNLTVWKYDQATGQVVSNTPEKSFRVGKSQDRVLLSNDGKAAYVKGELDPLLGHGVGYGVMIVPLDNPTAISPIQVPNAPAPLQSGPGPVVFPMESALSEDGKVLFTAHGEGVSSINVSNPLDCTLLTDAETIPQEYYSIAVVGQQAFAVGYTPVPRLLEIDISDPSALVMSKLLRFTFKRPVSVAANKQFFYIADWGTDCVVVIDRATKLATWAGCEVVAGGRRPNRPVRGHRGSTRGQTRPQASAPPSSPSAPVPPSS
ncbi:hypothetical protein CBR_g665 [Chara braunii]|uniref:YncE family protein n=1 Tax=Chara braunii TaxID=69332 RepID=A0A388KBU5_CHABU|nr:hypothetical protein CBR_g665 [Chara braunii]|eukprot:GBG67534.1 hypothetical protein CBR_g665 [Chara braunii]